MIIDLIDARRGLYNKCSELFGDANIAAQIYRYLCDGIEDCETVEAEPFKAFAHWLASEVCNEGFEKMWSLGAFAEVACRKLCKLGLVRKDGEYWKMDEVKDE